MVSLCYAEQLILQNFSYIMYSGLNTAFTGGSYWIPGSWNLRMSYTDAIPFPDPGQEANGADQHQESCSSIGKNQIPQSSTDTNDIVLKVLYAVAEGMYQNVVVLHATDRMLDKDADLT